MPDQIQASQTSSGAGAPRRVTIKLPVSRIIAEIGIDVVKELGYHAKNKLRRGLEDWIASWTTGPHQADNVRRMVSVYDHIDTKDVLIWLSRLRKVSMAQDGGSYVSESVIGSEHAEDLYRNLISGDMYEKGDAKEAIRSIAVKLVSKDFVFAVSYSYLNTSDVQRLYHLVLQKHRDLRSVVLWVDQHRGLSIESKQPWFEYGLIPYVLCETTTIGFDTSRTWMLVERAVRDGVNKALHQSKRKVVDATSYVRKSLMQMAQSDVFRMSQTGWRRDKEYLKLMIKLSKAGEYVFKLKTEEIHHWRTHTFSKPGNWMVGGFERVYPVGLLKYIPQQDDEDLKTSHAETKEMAWRMRLSSENESEKNREYWEKVAALDAFEAYAQGYNVVKVIDSQYEINMGSAEDVLRSALRIILVIMLLLLWDRREWAAVFMRYMGMACDVLLDVLMFMHFAMTGGDEGGKDVLDLILLKAMVALSHVSLAVFLIMTPLKWIIRQTLGEIIRSGFDPSHVLVTALSFGVGAQAIGGLGGLVVMVVFTSIVGTGVEFLLRRFGFYLVARALIILRLLIKTIWSRRVSGIGIYVFITLQCTMHVLSSLSTTIPTQRMAIIEETAIKLERLAALALGSALLFAVIKTSMRHGSIWRGRRRYAGRLAIFAVAKGISEQSGAFYLGMDHEMRAHSYFGPFQVTDISGREQDERDAVSHFGFKPPAYTVALRNGFVVA